jgi:hypothetical protein
VDCDETATSESDATKRTAIDRFEGSRSGGVDRVSGFQDTGNLRL